MEAGRGRPSTSEILKVISVSPTTDRVKSLACHELHYQQHHHPKNRSLKMFNKVQVVYYLTRNGQLEHPHFMEVSHLASQPLRLKDVMERLTVLRGKAMPCQYSWSCKRSYKNGYVWNDLTENDVIYTSDGSEYVLKGSELLHERDYSGGSHQGPNKRQVATKLQERTAIQNYEQTENNDDEKEEEEKGSCNSSNAPYPTMQVEQDESYSLPSTSSTNSDKQPPLPLPVQPTQVGKTTASESKRFEKEVTRSIQEDGDPTVSTSLTRNSTVLLHLIACGGSGIVNTQGKVKAKAKSNFGSSKNFNFSMKNSFIPCLKQQLSTRGVSPSNNAVPLPVKAEVADERQPCNNCQAGNGHGYDHQVVSEEDEDLMMVRYMSENPRFGNLQSEEKEYFSGTIVEAMSTHHQHTHSSGSGSGSGSGSASASNHPHSLILTKSSSYNEQRSTKAGLAEAAASTALEDEDEKQQAKVRGIIKLCIPRKKSCSSTSTKHA